MRSFEKSFSIIYVLVLLACIFFRIESWPFSDWRVYDLPKRPSDILYFQVVLESDGKLLEPFTTRSYGLKVDQEFKSTYYDDNQSEFLGYCLKVYKHLKPKYQFEKLIINRITVNDDMSFQQMPFCVRSHPDQEKDPHFYKDWY